MTDHGKFSMPCEKKSVGVIKENNLVRPKNYQLDKIFFIDRPQFLQWLALRIALEKIRFRYEKNSVLLIIFFSVPSVPTRYYFE